MLQAARLEDGSRRILPRPPRPCFPASVPPSRVSSVCHTKVGVWDDWPRKACASMRDIRSSKAIRPSRASVEVCCLGSFWPAQTQPRARFVQLGLSDVAPNRIWGHRMSITTDHLADVPHPARSTSPNGTQVCLTQAATTAAQRAPLTGLRIRTATTYAWRSTARSL